MLQAQTQVYDLPYTMYELDEARNFHVMTDLTDRKSQDARTEVESDKKIMGREVNIASKTLSLP